MMAVDDVQNPKTDSVLLVSRNGNLMGILKFTAEKERETERETDRQTHLFDLMIHFPNGHNSLG